MATYSFFISHSSKDHTISKDICNRLEAIGVRCWIAPRDIAPGETYGSAILRGIENSTGVILVLSERSNLSSMVESEIERASNLGKTIVPIRINNVLPSKNVEFFISKFQWLDAYDSPLADRIEYLAAVAHALENSGTLPVAKPQRSGLVSKIETGLESIFRYKLLAASLSFVFAASISVAILWFQWAQKEALTSAASSIADTKGSVEKIESSTSRLTNAFVPALAPGQADEAMRSALRKGDQAQVRSLSAQGVSASGSIAAGLIGELVGQRDQIRSMLDAFRAARGVSSLEGEREVASILKSELELVKRLAANDVSTNDAVTVRSICGLAGMSTPLGRALSNFAQTPEVCQKRFKDQSIIEPLWKALIELTWSGSEVGLHEFAQVDWLETIVRLYSDVSVPRASNSDDEYRTFIDLDVVTEPNMVLGALETQKPIFLEGYAPNGAGAEAMRMARFRVAGLIAIAEGAIWFEKRAPVNENEWIIASMSKYPNVVSHPFEAMIGIFRPHISSQSSWAFEKPPAELSSCANNIQSFYESWQTRLSGRDLENLIEKAKTSRAVCNVRVAVTLSHVLDGRFSIINLKKIN